MNDIPQEIPVAIGERTLDLGKLGKVTLHIMPDGSEVISEDDIIKLFGFDGWMQILKDINNGTIKLKEGK